MRYSADSEVNTVLGKGGRTCAANLGLDGNELWNKWCSGPVSGKSRVVITTTFLEPQKVHKYSLLPVKDFLDSAPKSWELWGEVVPEKSQASVSLQKLHSVSSVDFSDAADKKEYVIDTDDRLFNKLELRLDCPVNVRDGIHLRRVMFQRKGVNPQYTGEFANGKQQGYGSYRFCDGRTKKGYWVPVSDISNDPFKDALLRVVDGANSCFDFVNMLMHPETISKSRSSDNLLKHGDDDYVLLDRLIFPAGPTGIELEACSINSDGTMLGCRVSDFCFARDHVGVDENLVHASVCVGDILQCVNDRQVDKLPTNETRKMIRDMENTERSLTFKRKRPEEVPKVYTLPGTLVVRHPYALAVADSTQDQEDVYYSEHSEVADENVPAFHAFLFRRNVALASTDQPAPEVAVESAGVDIVFEGASLDIDMTSLVTGAESDPCSESAPSRSGGADETLSVSISLPSITEALDADEEPSDAASAMSEPVTKKWWDSYAETAQEPSLDVSWEESKLPDDDYFEGSHFEISNFKTPDRPESNLSVDLKIRSLNSEYHRLSEEAKAQVHETLHHLDLFKGTNTAQKYTPLSRKFHLIYSMASFSHNVKCIFKSQSCFLNRNRKSILRRSLS